MNSAYGSPEAWTGEIRLCALRAGGVDSDDSFDRIPLQAFVATWKGSAYTLTEIARHFRLRPSTASQMARIPEMHKTRTDPFGSVWMPLA